MLMNYHEMTMNEPRDSPQRRKQFLVICSVMASTMLAAIVQAGGFQSVQVEEEESSGTSIFPGGTFVYRYTQRDYAATGSLHESIGKDLGLKPKAFDDKLYAVYLDDPHGSGLAGRELRFASGYLVTDKKTEGHIPSFLMGLNKDVKAPTKEEIRDLPANKLWPKLAYQQTSLPSVNCAVVHFPFTNGFVSSIILSHKVIPALRKYVTEHAQGLNARQKKQNARAPVVLSTCSITDQMCTHYAPLYKSKDFLLGKPDSETYQKELGPPPSLLDWEKIKTSWPFYHLF